jgi:hypothetical protein
MPPPNIIYRHRDKSSTKCSSWATSSNTDGGKSAASTSDVLRISRTIWRLTGLFGFGSISVQPERGESSIAEAQQRGTRESPGRASPLQPEFLARTFFPVEKKPDGVRRQLRWRTEALRQVSACPHSLLSKALRAYSSRNIVPTARHLSQGDRHRREKENN